MQYPVNLEVAGRACLVVGAGRIGLRKAQHLAACGARLTVVAPLIDPGFSGLEATLVERPWRASDLDGMRLVITATGDRTVDQAVFDAAEARGIWVNSADDPDRCSFTLPAVVRRGPVMVTTSTGGASPALSSWLRARLERMLADEFADVAAELSRLRAEVHAGGGSTEEIDWQPIVTGLVARHVPTSCPALLGTLPAGAPATPSIDEAVRA